MGLRARRFGIAALDGLGGPSYRFPQIVTALSIVFKRISTGTGPVANSVRRKLDFPLRLVSAKIANLFGRKFRQSTGRYLKIFAFG